MNEENIIEIRDLVTHYEERKILDGVTFDVKKGETLVILGGSGCGKSTLLRHMIRLLTPTSGEIWVDGTEITRIPENEMNEVRKKFGMLFQGSALFNSMTLGENVSLPLREHTNLDDNVIKIVTRIKLEQVGLSGFEDLKPAELSGGMKKRAGLARAMAMDPKILFFDEPSAGLDPIVAAGLDDLIIKLKQAFRMTIIVVTHEMGSAFRIADKMLMLHEGKVIFYGTPDEIKLCEHPRVQQFLRGEADPVEQDTEKYLNLLTRN